MLAPTAFALADPHQICCSQTHTRSRKSRPLGGRRLKADRGGWSEWNSNERRLLGCIFGPRKWRRKFHSSPFFVQRREATNPTLLKDALKFSLLRGKCSSGPGRSR